MNSWKIGLINIHQTGLTAAVLRSSHPQGGHAIENQCISHSFPNLWYRLLLEVGRSFSVQKSSQIIEMPHSVNDSTDPCSQLYIQRSGYARRATHSWEPTCMFSLKKLASEVRKLKDVSQQSFLGILLKKILCQIPLLNMHFC